MPDISIKDVVSKLERSRVVREEQLQNMFCIVETLEVSKLETSMLVREEQ